ncbi:uncharacterized protein LOC116175079 [Photinus pyralis]|uniref:uncharacterized protein LOC116175079 n=1 Tax=Photinus pyralis TaxID=7054 RepID=UPI0012672205|nr:uncharacterized protein LOC116175079 [Photinus pyralis]
MPAWCFVVLLCVVTQYANSDEIAKLQPKNLVPGCIVEVLHKVFPKNVSFAYILNDHPEYFPNNFNVPRVIVNISRPINGYYGNYENDYVIEAKTGDKLITTIHKLIRSPIWERGRTNRGRFLLITAEKNLTLTFRVFWQIHIIKVVVIQYKTEFDGQNVTVITGNPFDERNGCGKVPTAFRYQQCDSRLSVIFDEYVRDFGRCEVITGAAQFGLKKPFYLPDYIILSMLELIEEFLNARVIRSTDMTVKEFYELGRHNAMVILLVQYGLTVYVDTSNEIWTESFIWIGPTPKVISPCVTYFIPFKGILWIIVIVTLIAVTLTWWLMLYKTESSRTVSAISVDVISLLLGVSISTETRRIALRILIIFYLVYVIHIQTVYTSNLINILILPKYENSINNMDQLEKSDMEIYVPESLYEYYLKNNLEHYEGIKGRLTVIKNDYTSYVKKLNHTNYFIVGRRSQVTTFKQHASAVANYLKGKKQNFFFCEFSGLLRQVNFAMFKGSYFLPSLNRIISYLYESGYHSWLTNSVDYTYNAEPDVRSYEIAELAQHDFQTGLKLIHVSGAFFILALGYGISVAVFLMECVIYRVSARMQRIIVL